MTRSDQSEGANAHKKEKLTNGAVIKCTSLGKLQIHEEQLAKKTTTQTPRNGCECKKNDLFAQVDLESLVSLSCVNLANIPVLYLFKCPLTHSHQHSALPTSCLPISCEHIDFSCLQCEETLFKPGLNSF